MNKKILLLLLIPVVLFMMTGCGETHEKGTKDKKLTKTIELSDSKLGFTTTFTYDAEEKYSDVEEDDSGKSTAIEFKNEELDVSFNMYYTTMKDTTYNETEKARSKQKFYKHYKFGDYEGYVYSEYEDKANLNILLGIDEDKVAEVLFVSIERIDVDESVIVPKLLEEKELQAFFKSMEFVKE